MSILWRPPRRQSIIPMLEEAIRRDPGDGPAVYLEADIFADDLARYTPTAEEPDPPIGGGDHEDGSATLPG